MAEEYKKPRAKKNRWRLIHRYLGFFLAGIMAIYAISGIVMIFRDTSFLKKTITYERNIGKNLTVEAVGKEIGKRNLKYSADSSGFSIFENGLYLPATGNVKYSTTELPFFLKKLTQLHKANTKQPLYYLNVFFGFSLLFFVLSSFWMFRPKSSVFKKGIYWTLGGIALTLLMLFYK